MSANTSTEDSIEAVLEPCWEDELYPPFPCRCECHAPSLGHHAFINKHHEACCSKSPCAANVAYGFMLRHIEECDECKRILRNRSI